ncbi:dimethyladenosine transferase 2, mitochondrial isoform X2 [Artibeus jamaicensis]|uniref:dimethyladenosine transferase 2, mitochondrial isoform X2 n=1 Tax=Artibeus jamaicensis TaxID=9417 RepID=UPI00235B19D5|nr:dimethyladenosine transferase 2, mitochondrial isoform X2 [Artibeus jamaicensis]
MWVPVAGLPPRLKLSAASVAGRFCIWRSGAARWKDAPVVARRGLSDFHPQVLPGQDFRELPSRPSKYGVEPKRYLTSPRLAETVVQFLLREDDPCKLILECNPGPGILTQALIQGGARVIALESDKTFIPHLESLGKQLGGKLHVVHCDFFKLDPGSSGAVRPTVDSRVLLQDLAIETLPWSKGIPLKVVGIFPAKNEKKMMWKFLHDIYSCTSLYRYGRVELNFFMNETDCQEPWSSFDKYTRAGRPGKPEHGESLEQQTQQNLCFIQFTPRRNLFTQNLTPVNYDVFFHMLKQCFLKRNAKLIDQLHSLSPVDAEDVLKKMKKRGTTKVTDMHPLDFKRLFETIECSKDYSCKWLYDEFMEDVVL